MAPEPTLPPVTVIGLGPMGHALAAAFLAAGHPTTVWNRTPGKGADLEGALHAATAEDAVRASDVVVVCVRDDAALHQVLDPAAVALAGRTLVNFTTSTPREARNTAAWAVANGARALDGVIFARTVDIGTASASVLYAGDEQVFADRRPTLAVLGGADHVGTDAGSAAVYDTVLHDSFWTSVSGLLHSFALAKASGISGAAVAPFLRSSATMLDGMIDAMAAELDAGRYSAEEVDVAGAGVVVRRVLDVVEETGLDAPALRSFAELLERAVDAGHGRAGLVHLTEVIGREPAPL
ncbi:NAD(P)-dependent oxidoreductase [Pseudonocardia sp. TRM90224]|uniref:NAD(P)-dependent oxidoreductase n=1 Tax=Pseudonocardia sp. TRM90224 TaxID=2812678 RepID=UPI001E30DC07|nr:NAD(P)-binding domain-containing protein [Pseudonocardia sp. TRM90224]